MNFNRLIFRAWFYFRSGYSLYIAFPLGFIQAVIVVYQLGIVPSIKSGGTIGGVLQFLFPHLTEFIIIGALALIPISIAFGLYHYRRTGAYEADASVAAEENPYAYKAVPEKEQEVYMPVFALMMEGMRGMLEQQNGLTPEMRKQFDDTIQKARLLIEGRGVGRKG